MMTTRYQRSNSTEVSKTNVDLGLTDEKGRRIGYVIVRRAVTLTAAPESKNWHAAYTMESEKFVEGQWYEGWVQATRNGEQYGASQRSMLMHNPEDLERRIEAKVADMVKRYTKKHGRA